MNDLIRSVIGYAFVVVLIVGGFKLYKSTDKAVIEPTDTNIDFTAWNYGSYTIKSKPETISEFKQGDAVAYWVPGEGGEHKVAFVVALEGQMVEHEKKVLKVNGKTISDVKIDCTSKVPPIRVPRGCLFLFHNKTVNGKDSTIIGPVPLTHIRGKLNSD